jgi:hypothetical protein
MPWSLETMYEIWDDDSGDKIEVGPDRDGLDMVEIRWRTDDGKIAERMTFTQEAVPLLIEALTKALADAKAAKEKAGG